MPGALVLLALFGLPPAGGAAQDREEILSYHVEIEVRPGGSMLVTEEITVRALGDEIRRGIYRDFPTSFPRESGFGRIEAPFEPETVLRNGVEEPHTLTAIGGPIGRGGVRVRIGDPDVVLAPGIHTYTIRYLTDRWVSFGSDSDRLYWNVTGNAWSFPIRSASARVRIDEVRAAPELEAWTGPEGSTAGDVENVWDPATRTATFATTRSLAPGEGLTARITFGSGQLTPPSEAQREAWFALDWGAYVESGWVVLLVIAVYLVMWRRVGVDPIGRPSGARQEPPAGFSPAALGYLERRGYDMSHFAAALVSMAVKGAIRIERDDDTWRLHNVDGAVDLSAEERAVFDALLGGRRRITLAQSEHQTLSTAMQAFRRRLSEELEDVYFENNRGWFLAGLLVSVLGLGVLAWRWRFGVEPVSIFLAVWLTGWTAGVVMIGKQVVTLFRAARADGGVIWGGFIFLALFSLPFIAAEIGVSAMLLTMMPTHLVLAALAVGVTNVVFYHLLERPTLRGRGVLDQLEGFRAYLSGNGDRRRPASSGTPGAFERFLPHAIALGLETRWAEGFGDALRATARAASDARVIPWYDHRTPDRKFSPVSFASSLGTTLASKLSSSSSPPSSGGSGGSSGGGSSGGGGGGGGGGGW
jgi:uncharacterized membrane protein YgcG